MSQTERASTEAFVTLATNDAYSVGALVLGQSLRAVQTTRQLVVMVTSQVSQATRDQLAQTFDHVIEVDVLDSGDQVNLDLLTRPDLGLTFTKLHCWRLTQFSKCVFLDADTLVLQNIDELFGYDQLAAAPDVGWPDCFNSGVFVFCPSEETYRALLNFAITHGSFDGGDQGLLNLFFCDWSTQGANCRLPFIYNTVAQAFYSYAPAYKRFGHNVKVIHFIGAVKPWHVGYNTATRTLQGDAGEATQFLQQWWNVFMDRVHHNLSDHVKLSLAEKGSQATFGHPGDAEGHQSFPKHQLDDGHRQYNWERGQIDYMGVDSFENIKRQLDAKILPSNGDAQGKPGHADADHSPGKVNGDLEVKSSAPKDIREVNPVQFDEDSEFRKMSIDKLIRPAPKRSVHRATLTIPRKVYNEQVKTLTGSTQGKAAPKVEATSPVKAQAGSKTAEIAVSPDKSHGPSGATKVEHRPLACSYVAEPLAGDVPSHGTSALGREESRPVACSYVAQPSDDVPPTYPSGPQGSAFHSFPTDTQGKISSSGLESGFGSAGFESFSPADLRGGAPYSGLESSGTYGLEASYPADTQSHRWSSTEAESDGSFATGFESFSSPSLSKGDASSSGHETGGSTTYVFESFSSSSTTGGHVSSPAGLEAGGFVAPSSQPLGFSLTSSSPTATGGSFPSSRAQFGVESYSDSSPTKVEASISKSSASSKISVDPFGAEESSHDLLLDVKPVAPVPTSGHGDAAAATQKQAEKKKSGGKRGKK